MSEDSQELDLELSRTARLIRRHCDAFLRFDEHFQPVRYCRATDGRLIIPAMAAMQMAEELVLHVPDATDQSLQLMVTGQPFGDHDPLEVISYLACIVSPDSCQVARLLHA